MSFKLPRYASPCLSLTTFQVQAYFEDLTQSRKKPSAQVLGSLCQASAGERGDVGIFSPVLFRFYEGNLLLFFLNPIKATRANIRSGGIELSWKQVTGLLFNAGYFAIPHSVLMGVKYVCQRVYPRVLCTSGVFPACAGSPTPPAKCVSTEPKKQLGSLEFVIRN